MPLEVSFDLRNPLSFKFVLQCNWELVFLLVNCGRLIFLDFLFILYQSCLCGLDGVVDLILMYSLIIFELKLDLVALQLLLSLLCCCFYESDLRTIIRGFL